MCKPIIVFVLLLRSAFSAPASSTPSFKAPQIDIPEPLLDPEDYTVWAPMSVNADENSREFWLKSGQHILKETLQRQMNKKVAKNLIILVADGMSIPTQMATRMYMGGEEKVLSFEKFPYVGLSKTYCVDYQVPDSGCTATAFLSGIKTNFGVLSMSGKVPLRNCSAESDQRNHVDSIFKFAQDAKKSTGIVTNTRLTHATPAAAYAKSACRYWENDSQTPPGCKDLAYQLIHGDIGKNFNVILGGGYQEFIPNNRIDQHGRIGKRTDNRDLIREWMFNGRRPLFVHDRATLNTLNVRYFDKLFGLFSESHMQYHSLSDRANEPTLMEMTLKALQMVSKNPNGYVLMVESGRIDHAHHETRAKLALEETVQFHDMVEFVRARVNESETLIVVFADHSHTMSVSGYPKRGTDILSLGAFSREDNMPYFTLSYANGMGFAEHFNESGRVNPLEMNFNDPLFMQPATVPLHEETHAGDDVGVYAVGPYSHLFAGVYEQHYIAHAMMYATCLGPDNFLKACDSAAVVKLPFVMIVMMTFARLVSS